MDFKKIKYINLHAHSDYSLQDGVGAPREHFLETIRKGHTGCCITDHASYAAPFELYNIKLSEKKDKEIQELYKKYEKENGHAIVPGVELYVYDDSIKIEVDKLLSSASNPDTNKELLLEQIKNLMNSVQNNPLLESLFSDKETFGNNDVMSDDTKKKEANRTGEKVLVFLDKVPTIDAKTFNQDFEKLLKLLGEFGVASTRCKSYKYNHITLMAKNETGHRNICKLVSNSHLPSNFYVRPRIALSELFQRKEGIIATTGCFIGMIPQAIYKKTGKEDGLFSLFLKEFKDDFYVEIHLGDLSWNWVSSQKAHVKGDTNPQLEVNLRLLELVEKYELWTNTYITQDSHMPKKEDKEQQDLMILSDNSNSNGWHFKDAYYIMTVEEMWEKCMEFHSYITLKNFVTMCENTQSVQEKCRGFYIDKTPKLVDFNYADHHSMNPKRIRKDLVIEGEVKRPYGRSIESLVKESKRSELLNEELDLAETELARAKIEQAECKIDSLLNKYKGEYHLQKVLKASITDMKLRAMVKTCIIKGKINLDLKEHRDRLFFEMNTMQLNGYQELADYFMMVEELPYVARELGELPGLGRGSAAGSFVCYALDITNVDSLKMSLSFARFLPKERNGTLNFNFQEFPIYDFMLKHFPNGENDYDVSLLDLREDFLKGLECPDKSHAGLKRELNYIYHNPELCFYLNEVKNLKENGLRITNTCNSHVAFLMGLTTEPVSNIDEDKGSLPDIDFDSSCRDDLCEFESQKHGRERTILIGTYGSLQVKSALKEILRIKPASFYPGEKYILSPKEMNDVTQLLDRVKFNEEEKEKGALWMFEESLVRNNDVRDFFDLNKDIYEYTKKVLGTKKSWGIHAAGIIMSGVDTSSWIPCFYSAEKKSFVSQLDMELVESFGFVKMDALGLITLEIIRDSMYMIKRNHNIDLFDKLEELAFSEDENVLANFAPKANTLGIFQFGTPVPTAYLRRVQKPVKFAFLPMTTSELRPGPMGANVHEDILKVINGASPIVYLHPMLEEILEKTYGYIVYQEQVIKICILLGLTPYEADTVRKAMGKKKFDLIHKWKVKFIKGAVGKGMKESEASHIWDVMSKFAEYGFNESHAVAYAGLSVVQMHLKTYYLAEFVASSLSTFSKKDTPTNKENYKKFHRAYKDIIVTPSVQTSQLDYTIKDSKVVMPIFAISRIGEEASKNIFSLAPFKSFTDMILKFKAYGCESKTVVENLIVSGACDVFRPNLTNLKKIALNDDSLFTHDEQVLAITSILDVVTYKIKDSQDPLLGTIKFDLYQLKTLPRGSDLEELFNSNSFKKGINVFDFRKMLLVMYYGDLYHRKIHKKVTDAIESDSIDIIKKGFVPEKIRLEILETDHDKNNFGNGLSSVSQDVVDAIYSVKKVVSRGTDGNITKMSENIDVFNNLSIQEMIIKELELLKTTTYDFSSLIDQNEDIGKTVSISSLKVSLGIIRSKLEICAGSIDLARRLLSSQDITAGEAVYCVVNSLNLISEILPTYSSKKIFSKVINSILKDPSILKNDKEEFLCRVNFVLKIKNNKNIPRDIKRTIKLKGLIGRKYLSAFKNITKSTDNDFVGKAEIEMKLDLMIDEEFRFYLFSYIIKNGKKGINDIRDLFPDCQEISNIGKSVVDLNITPEVIKEWRAVIDMFEFNNPIDTIVSGAQRRNSDKGEISVLEISTKLQDFGFSEEEISLVNSKIYVVGAVFRPEKKKDFKRDYVSNGKLKSRLSITLAENGDDVIDLAIFDSQSYQDIFVNNNSVKIEEILKDYSIVKLRVRAQFTDDLSDYRFSLDTGAGSLVPIKFKASTIKETA